METSIEELKKWYKTMAVLCIVSAFMTFILFIGSRYQYHTDAYSVSVVHFWAGFVLTILFGMTSATVRKIYKCLIFVVNRNTTNEVLVSDSEENIAQTKCPKCGNLYDIDYPKCPLCKYNDKSKSD